MDLLSKSKDAVVDALTRATEEVAINKSKFNFAQSMSHLVSGKREIAPDNCDCAGGCTW